VIALLAVRRVFRAANHSLIGIRDAIAHHKAFRQEVVIGVVLTPLAIWLGDDGVQEALLIGALLIVLIVELVNSGIEKIIDRIGTGHHELSRRVKDLRSVAVFVVLANVPLVWDLVLFY
jgi:diacylglycerol kinase (ATP)